MAEETNGAKKRGKRGGIKHTPGRDHDRKSHLQKKERIGKRLKKRREERDAKAEIEQRQLEQLSDEARKILQRPTVRISRRKKK